MSELPRQTNYSKGDFPRKVDRRKWEKNWLKIFGVKCPECKGVGIVDYGDDFMARVTDCKICNGLGYVEKKRK